VNKDVYNRDLALKPTEKHREMTVKVKPSTKEMTFWAEVPASSTCCRSRSLRADWLLMGRCETVRAKLLVVK